MIKQSNNLRVYVILLGVFFLTIRCKCIYKRKNTDLKGFNTQLWIMDKKACTGYRQSVIDTILFQEGSIIGLDSLQVKSIFGDEDEGGRKVFNVLHYYIIPGGQCNNSHSETSYLVIVFNKSGIVKNLMIEKE